MQESDMSHFVGTLVALGILMFVVYRILQTLNNQTHYSGGAATGGAGGKVYHMPERKPSGPPSYISLKEIPEEQNPFTDDMATEAAKTLVERGELEFIGNYSVDEMPGYFLSAFTHPEHSLVGIIYRDPAEKLWVNLITEYSDGRIITTTSAEDVPKGARPKGMPLFHFPSLALDQLLRRHKLETREVPKAEAKRAEDFADFFISNYARLRENIDKKASTGNEPIKLSSWNAPPPPPVEGPANEPMDEIEEKVDLSSPEPSPGQLKAWLNEIYSKISIPKEQKAQFQSGLVYVLNGAKMDAIAETFSDYTEVEVNEVENNRWVIQSKNGAEDIIAPGELSGPTLFDKINGSLPEELRFNRIPVDLQGVSFYSRLAI